MPIFPVKNLLLLFQVTCYVLAFVLSFCFFVPVVVHLGIFNGHCILFSNGTRNETGHLVVLWASQLYCDLDVAVGILEALVAFFQIYRISGLLCRGIDSSFFSSFVETASNFLVMLLSLGVALLVSWGFKTWCDSIIVGYQSCAGASVSGIYKEDQYALSHIYMQMGTAQFGAWGSWVCWVSLTVFALLQLCRHHQRENLQVSMAQERQRLLQEGAEEANVVAT